MSESSKTTKMPSYNVEKVLQSIFNEEDSSWQPADKIAAITKEIEKLKLDMKVFLDNGAYDVAAIVNESRELCKDSQLVVDDMVQCKQEIEQETMAEILKSIENHDLLVKELNSVNFALDIVCDVVRCGKYLKEFNYGKEAGSYTRAVEAMLNMMQHLDNPVEGFRKLDLYASTKNKCQLILDSLLYELFLLWDEMVMWSSKTLTRKTVVTIKLNIDDTLPTIDIINALDKSKKLNEKVSEFAQFLLKEIIGPVIHCVCTVYAETDVLMTVTINHKENNKPQYDDVISNLRLLFHYLSNKLNIVYNKDYTIMKMIGKQISKEFRDMLVNDCLIDTIPNNINELQTYGKITSQIEDFRHFLANVKIFPDDDFSILQYVENIDILFANKSSQHFFETARTIMLKDLSATMSIGVEHIPEVSSTTPTYTEDESTEQALKILDKTIPKSLFYFPRCMISKTAQELLDLVYVMMEQAVQCSDVVCKKLYNTTRLVFELYDAVVPYHHENYLQTIPQYVALFHNNCMYLAHSLQTFGDKWLVLLEGRELHYSISFVDLVQKLRDLGYKHLTIHMQQQRKQILDNIRSSDLNSIVVKDVLGDNADTAVRQCLRQLQLLKNVWIGVLPVNVFTRLMATLVNMLVEELIHRVCCAEDVSAEMAGQLTDMYQRVVLKAPGLFQNQSDIETHVKAWTKLQKLIFILGGSLKDIELQWADGTGPLATHFRTEELRNLIKALFQNTQIRANLLSKIK